MRELGKYFRIYCEETHKKWPLLVPYIQDWLNSSVIATTGYTPVELFNGTSRQNMFKELLKVHPDQLHVEESVPQKILHAYARCKLKAEKRNLKRKNGKYKWMPKLNDLVLVRQHPTSDAIQDVTIKFQRPYEGPYIIQTIVNPSLFELKDRSGRRKGLFNKRHLKPYLEIKNDLNMISIDKERPTDDTRPNKDDLDYWKIRLPSRRKKGLVMPEINREEDLAASWNQTWI
jgi:hypothetical protein